MASNLPAIMLNALYKDKVGYSKTIIGNYLKLYGSGFE